MNRIESAFVNAPVFMPYFPVGYPNLPTSIDVMEALAKNGADLMEVGLPFSDPLADGKIIQQATQVALQNGVTTRQGLEAVAELRRRGVQIPLILMGYYNPILAYGLKKFVQDAQTAGADAFIIPDLPPEEAEEFSTALEGTSLLQITMLAPTTPPERMERLARHAQGFIYLVSVTGVTGTREGLAAGLDALVARVREHASVPVCVGFGIASPEQAKAVGALADGVIVGSACVREVGGAENPAQAAEGFASRFAAALRRG